MDYLRPLSPINIKNVPYSLPVDGYIINMRSHEVDSDYFLRHRRCVSPVDIEEVFFYTILLQLRYLKSANHIMVYN